MTIPYVDQQQELVIKIGEKIEHGIAFNEGTIEFQPTQRLNVIGYALQLPTSFEVKVNVIGEPWPKVIPMLVNDSQWCWKITERMPAGKTFYTNIPKLADGEVLNYFDLIEIDPETFDPIVQVPAWQALEDKVYNAKLDINDIQYTLNTEFPIRFYSARNKTGVTIPKGTAVTMQLDSGTENTSRYVRPAKADSEANFIALVGVASEDILNNNSGRIATLGLIPFIDTSSANVGDPIWLSPTNAGEFIYGLDNKPVAPDYAVLIGFVSRKNTVEGNGQIWVNLQNSSIAEKGDQGIQGIQGEQGEPAPTPEAIRWTPTLQAHGLTISNIGSVESAPCYQSYYVQTGQLVTFNIKIDFASVTNFGTGQLTLLEGLPIPPIESASNQFSGIFIDQNGLRIKIVANHETDSDTLKLYFLNDAERSPNEIIQNELSQGNPVTLTTRTHIHINGTYISSR